MSTPPPNQLVPEVAPLELDRQGKPLLYDAYGMVLHLEPLTRDDEPRLEAAMGLVLDWLGPHLRWTLASTHTEVEPFDPTDFEMVSMHCRQLDNPTAGGPVDDEDIWGLGAASADRHHVICHGGPDNNVPSPFTFHFYSSIPDPDGEPTFKTTSCLMLTVPRTWPLKDFSERVWAIAKELRFRWGNAGLAYAGWQYGQHNATRQSQMAHARRYPGFDVGLHAAWMDTFHDRIRSVSWLTLIGPALCEEIRASGGQLSDGPVVRAFPMGDAVVLQAGPAPAPGDTNRLQLPPAYVEADRLVRSVRASTGLHFQHPWSEQTTEQWLRRFERLAH